MKSKTSILNIYFDEELNLVIMEWKGYSTSIQFRQGIELMLKFMVLNNCSNVLANIREMVLIGVDDQKWLYENFFLKAIKFGFNKIAIITPESYFNKIGLENVSNKIDKKKLKINFFDDVEEAKEWLKTTNAVDLKISENER